MVALKRTPPEGFVLDGEQLAPRTRQERYRIYRVRNGGRPELLATCRTEGGVGAAVIRLGKAGEFDDAVLGVMDGRDHKDEKGVWIGRWIVRPWVAGGPSRKELRDASQGDPV